LAARSANSFSSVFGAPIHKKIIMSSVESGNEDCNCDVVVLEQPHCYLLHSIALNSGDATGETTLKTTTMDDLTWRHFDEFREFGDWRTKCQVRVQKLESARQLNPM
jgi:hypothetical protein